MRFKTITRHSRANWRISNFFGALVVSSLAISGLSSLAHAADDNYPENPITMVVPYGPGSANDLLTRLVAPGLSQSIGTDVIVINRPGAGGAVGTGFISRAAPDGYTIGIAGSATLGVNPNLYDNLPYDTRDGFTPLIRLATAPNVLVVSERSEIENMADLLEALKSGQLRYNSFGNGTTQHLAGALLVNKTNSNADHIPYKNVGEAISALISNQIDFGFYALPAVLSHIQSGKLRPLATTLPAEKLANVPTLESLGLSDFDRTSVWFGLVGPAGMPAAVTERLRTSLSKSMADPNLRARLTDAGYVVASEEPLAEFTDFLSDQLVFWSDVIQLSGTTID